jgi:low affinity Fe/Cu permease
MDISRYISELLHEHDCVIIPGFGGFVCSYHPAEIHPGQHSFHPPSKRILFNKELKTNDGLLANHIAVKEKSSFNEALHKIEEEAHEMNRCLEEGERINLLHIGVLYADNQGNIQFDQDTTVNYLKEAFGLATFISPPIQRHQQKSFLKQETQIGLRKKQPARRSSLRLAYWSTGIAASFLLLVLVIQNFDRINPDRQNETGFFPSYTTKSESAQQSIERFENEPADVQQTVENQIVTYVEKDNTKISLDDDQIAGTGGESAAEVISGEAPSKIDVAPIDEPIRETLVETPAPSKMYHLIAGSFEREINAENLISEYAGYGYNPVVIGQAANGYYRVSIAAYLRKNEALPELEKARSLYNPNIWLLRQ